MAWNRGPSVDGGMEERREETTERAISAELAEEAEEGRLDSLRSNAGIGGPSSHSGRPRVAASPHPVEMGEYEILWYCSLPATRSVSPDREQ